jgi:mRNA interferase RelE/StbE
VYEVVIERKAEKDLDRLSSPIHRRVSESIMALATDPRPPGCRKLVGGDND